MIYQVLIVDDEPHIVDTIRGLLEIDHSLNVEIHTAYRGRQALKLCQEYPIQLLITDIQMPDMSGLELAKLVKLLSPDCDVILLTAYSDFTYAYEGIQIHASDYILKTENREIIRNRILKVLKDQEQSLRHNSWLKEQEENDPITQRLGRTLLQPDRFSQQEEAFSLLGFQEDSFPLLLLILEAPNGNAVQTGVLQKALKRYFQGRIACLCCSKISEQAVAVVISVDKEKSAIPGTWLMGIMERVQAVYTATAQTDCSLLYSYPIESLDQLSGKYQIGVRCAEEEPFAACVKVITDVKDEIPVTTIHYIKRYVKAHLTQDLSLSQISEVTGYNPTYLSRLFKEQTGETLNRYITRKKMEYITRLMQDPSYSLQQIVEESGFATRSYFHQFIKKETGMAPKQYRMHLGVGQGGISS